MRERRRNKRLKIVLHRSKNVAVLMISRTPTERQRKR